MSLQQQQQRHHRDSERDANDLDDELAGRVLVVQLGDERGHGNVGEAGEGERDEEQGEAFDP